MNFKEYRHLLIALTSSTSGKIFLTSFFVLFIWLIISIVMLTNYDEEVSRSTFKNRSLDENISFLRGKVNDLEGENDDLKSEISDLNEQLEESQNNYSSYYTRTPSSIPSNNYHNIGDLFKQKGTATVVEKKGNCNYILLENSNGFVVAQWSGGNCPDKGNLIAGELDTYGAQQLYNLSTQSMGDFWIESVRMSREDALQRFNIFCP